METIHFKTVDPLSQDLLREASRKGIALNWERYEKQQPQDGFLRLGLSCPYGCLQGPCRIDPFGRGAQQGICGLDKDGMVAAMLLRLTLQGVLESLPADPSGCPGGEIAWPAGLEEKARGAAGRLGGAAPSCAELLAAAPLLSRPSAAPETLIRQALRLALFATGLATQPPAAAPASCKVGYGLLAGDAPTIALSGRPDGALVAALSGAAGTRLVTLGDWIPCGGAFVPIACTTGEAETLLSSGRIDLLVAGPGSDPGLAALCATLKIAVATDQTAAAEIAAQAKGAFGRRNPAFTPEASLVSEAAVAAGLDTTPAKIALLGGADSLFGSLGYIPVELAKGLRGADCALGAWGDAALWILKQEIPATILAPSAGPVAAVASLAAAGKLAALQGICFTGLKGCRDLAIALGLAALGQRVLLATPIPVWGSEKVRGLLDAELAALGGTLAHFDHPVRAEELLDGFVRS